MLSCHLEQGVKLGVKSSTVVLEYILIVPTLYGLFLHHIDNGPLYLIIFLRVWTTSSSLHVLSGWPPECFKERKERNGRRGTGEARGTLTREGHRRQRHPRYTCQCAFANKNLFHYHTFVVVEYKNVFLFVSNHEKNHITETSSLYYSCLRWPQGTHDQGWTTTLVPNLSLPRFQILQ